MAPKKSTVVSSDVPVAPVEEAKSKLTMPKKTRAKPVQPEEVQGDKKQRVMSACSSDFVSSVQAALSPELAAKLKVKDVKEVCEVFVKALVGSVLEGKNVNFTNHMSFARKVRAARVYKNLKTKESITKPKHFVMTMTIKPNLRKQFDDIALEQE